MTSGLPQNSRPANVKREAQLQRAVVVFFVTGLAFLLLPGTFLGVWNLISISSRHDLERLSQAWLQAHGHAQIYGWIGTFILGIGFYSLSKMGDLPSFAVHSACISYALWTPGVLLRWLANVTGWAWRVALPVSALLELAGFLVFFSTVSRHKPSENPSAPRKPKEPWMLVVIASTFGFLFALLLNLFAVWVTSDSGETPAVGHMLDQRLLTVPIWMFLVPTVWGFNARWLPVFLGLRAPDKHRLFAALGFAWAGVAATLTGHALISACFIIFAAAASISALGVFGHTERPAKIEGVHRSFPFFVRLAYIWLAISVSLTAWAAAADRSGGIWGASRHALTVGFLGTIVFAIGQRVLPAFCGARVLFSKGAMFASLLLLNIGCTLRVCSEIPAYESFAYSQFFWRVLPFSAITELAAVILFAANLLITFARPPAHALNVRGSRPGETSRHETGAADLQSVQ